MWLIKMLDARTLTIVSVIIHANLIVLFALISTNHRRKYIKYFIWSLCFSGIGFALLSLRDVVGVFISIIVANLFIIAGPVLFAIGIEQLLERQSKRNFLIGLLMVHTTVFFYLTYINVNIMLRIVLISYELFILFLYMAFMFMKAHAAKPNGVRLFVSLVYLVNSIFYLMRILYTVFDLPSGDLFTDVSYLPFTLVVSIVFLMSRTIGVLLCIMIKYDEKLVSANKILAELSTTDHLTKVKNHRALLSGLDRELERVKRYGRYFTVVMVDIDHFKEVNDTYGHTIGDEVLIGLAKIFKEELRKVDVIGRYGGEEFMLVLPESGCYESVHLLKRIQDRVREHEWCVQDLNMTFSAGIYLVDKSNCTASMKEIIQEADELMYKAKRNGRDRIEYVCQM